MKRYVIVALLCLFASGCSSVITKKITVITDPADSEISVISGVDLKEQKYRSPATIIAEVPKDRARAAKAALAVRKESYKPMSILLDSINDGDILTIKLEKLLQIRYRPIYRLLGPAESQELQYRDKTIAASFVINDQGFQMRLVNLSAHTAKIRWEQAEYLDAFNQGYRLIPSGVRYQDRNNQIPDQLLAPGSSIQTTMIPINNIVLSAQKQDYIIKPLFSLDSDAAAGLKGMKFNLFIPIEIDRQIIPYNFKIEIHDVFKEIIKN